MHDMIFVLGNWGSFLVTKDTIEIEAGCFTSKYSITASIVFPVS
jgi:hypothetical protein